MHGGPFGHVGIVNAPSFHSGGNVTTSVIMKLLKECKNKLEEINKEAKPEEKRFWPNHLFIQMDNSGKDNKNYNVIKFVAILVALDCFQEVTLSFMLVGHTHAEADQMFSRISE